MTDELYEEISNLLENRVFEEGARSASKNGRSVPGPTLWSVYV